MRSAAIANALASGSMRSASHPRSMRNPPAAPSIARSAREYANRRRHGSQRVSDLTRMHVVGESETHGRRDTRDEVGG